MKRETISKDITTAESVPVARKRVALYCRVSTADQSCDRQVRDLTAFAERAGFTVVKTFVETASGSNLTRTERQKVIALAQAREIDAILVTELTRWGRSTVDLIETLQSLHAKNVSLLCQTGMEFDLSTPSGKLMLTLLAGFSQFERDLIAERTKSGLAATVARGTKLGRPTGNRTDAKHAEAVKQLRDSGFSIRDIASKLKISKDTVSRVLNTNN